jgi:hypothetical protein
MVLGLVIIILRKDYVIIYCFYVQIVCFNYFVVLLLFP